MRGWDGWDSCCLKYFSVFDVNLSFSWVGLGKPSKKNKKSLTNVKLALTPPLSFMKTIFIFMPKIHFLTNSKNM